MTPGAVRVASMYLQAAGADPATYTHVFLTPKSQRNLLPGEDQEREPQTVLGPGSATTNSPQDNNLEWPRTGEGAVPDTQGKQADTRTLPQGYTTIPNTEQEREDPYSGLHARTIPVPGDQYDIDDETKLDYETPTRKKLAHSVAQRYLNRTADGYKKRIPWKKQHRQDIQTRMEDKRYYKRNKAKIKPRMKRWYKKIHKNRQYITKKDQYEHLPQKFKRLKTAADTFTYDIRPPDANLEKPDMAPGSGEATPSAGGWWTKQTPDLTHKPQSPDVPEPGPENYPPASGKVIPDSMRFASMKTKVATRYLVATFNSDALLKQAATIGDILKHTDPAIQARAKKIKPNLQRADGANGIWTFIVPSSKDGDYTVRLKALPDPKNPDEKQISNLDIQISCDCEFFRWQGPEHYAVINKYLYKKQVGTAETPDEKDPAGKNWLCKHVTACLSMVDLYRLK